jgi:hypothetical protein
MRSHWTMAVLAAGVIGLSSCAQLQRLVEPEPEAEAPARVQVPVEEDLDDWILMVGGEPIANLLAQRERARAVLLEVLGVNLSDGQLAELLATFRSGDARAADVPQALTGVAGFPVFQLLDAYLAPPEQERRVKGKILHYYFNDASKGGYLEVYTEVQMLQGSSVVASDTYFWAIGVAPETFEVIERDDSSPDDPFPGTLQLPEEALDPNNPDGIWMRGLDHKLWAKGTGIDVVGIIENGKLLDPGHPLYASNADSCIDLMTAGYPPQNVLPPQPGYCLGRCEHPEVVNTH